MVAAHESAAVGSGLLPHAAVSSAAGLAAEPLRCLDALLWENQGVACVCGSSVSQPRVCQVLVHVAAGVVDREHQSAAAGAAVAAVDAGVVPDAAAAAAAAAVGAAEAVHAGTGVAADIEALDVDTPAAGADAAGRGAAVAYAAAACA